ncbi:MAG: phosphoribosyltransferase [Burkholderiaceae bacterium]|nr:phosphoribosyltransferase [Burkholderiaceae bacterium]
MTSRSLAPLGTFIDRDDAGRQLAKALARFKGSDPLVLAIPRGGVPIGAIVAAELGGQLDVVLVHKLRSPHSPETAIGAIDERGEVTLSPYADVLDFNGGMLEQEKHHQLDILRQRRIDYAQIRSRIDRVNRPVIVVDDGLATGLTMIAALKNARSDRPSRLVAAVPVAAQDSIAQIKPYLDEFVCLNVSSDFYSVGQFYQAFHSVSDAEVLRLLKTAGGGLTPITP